MRHLSIPHIFGYAFGMSKNRLDIEMFSRGLVRSRSLASDLIKRGKVTVNGVTVSKPSLEIDETDTILVAHDSVFVSRAGEKLAHALKTFNVSPLGLTILDIGSSTGGFSDCLLKNGAEKVVAVDVGTNQFDANLQSNPRVELHENTDVRSFVTEYVFDMAVIDVSFISLELVLPKAYAFVKKGGSVIALVKPQFEVGKEIADTYKGIISDSEIQKNTVEKIKTAAQKIGFKVLNETTSPIEGEKGNKEFLILLKK